MGATAVKTYLDDKGNPVSTPKTYLDEKGNPVSAPAVAAPQTQSASSQQTEQPPEQSWMSKVMDYAPLAAGVPGLMYMGGRKLLEKGSEMFQGTAQERSLADLKSIAQGNPDAPSPMMSGVRQFAPQTLGKIAEYAHGLSSPKALGITAAATLAPTITGAALIGHGLYNAAQTRLAPDYTASPDQLESFLGSMSEAASGGSIVAHTGPIPKLTQELATKAGIPARIMNSILRTKESSFKFGKNPGEVVAEQVSPAITEKGLLKNIVERKEAVGKQIEETLSDPIKTTYTDGKPKLVDLNAAVDSTIDSAISKAKGTGNQSLVSRLENLREGLKGENGFDAAANGGKVSPLEATLFKRFVGDSVKWTTDPLEGTVNDVLQTIYGKVKTGIEEAVPDVAKANDSYANLLTAEKNLDSAIKTKAGQNLGGFMDTAAGAAGLAVGGVLGGFPGAGVGGFTAYLLRRTAGSTAVKSGIASILAKKGIEVPAGQGPFGYLPEPQAPETGPYKLQPVSGQPRLLPAEGETSTTTGVGGRGRAWERKLQSRLLPAAGETSVGPRSVAGSSQYGQVGLSKNVPVPEPKVPLRQLQPGTAPKERVVSSTSYRLGPADIGPAAPLSDRLDQALNLNQPPHPESFRTRSGTIEMWDGKKWKPIGKQ